MTRLKTKDRDDKKFEKYCGHYVAMKDFGDDCVISYGDNPVQVRSEATKKGADDPLIFFIPKKGMVSIY